MSLTTAAFVLRIRTPLCDDFVLIQKSASVFRSLLHPEISHKTKLKEVAE